MKRSRARASKPVARRRGPPLLVPVLMALCVGCALWVYRGTLTAFFSVDDIIVFERLRGLLPPLEGAWRIVSGPLYYSFMFNAFGTEPVPYHVVNWLLHGINVALLFLWVRRIGAGPWEAFLAAGLFGTSRFYLAVLYQAVTVSELLALTFTLGAFLCVGRAHLGWMLLAATSFALALLSKESVLLMPLILLLVPLGATSFAGRLVSAAPLMGLSGVMLASLLLAPPANFSGQAYATGYGVNLYHNLMTYVAWTVNLVDPNPGRLAVISPRAWLIGLPVTALAVALAFSTRRQGPRVIVGLAWWVLALGPVLPLLHHTYPYYLYVPMAGATLAVAGGLAALMEMWRSRLAAKVERRAGKPQMRSAALVASFAALALVMVIGHAWRSDQLLILRQSILLQGVALPADPLIRNSVLAQRVTGGLERGLPDTTVRVAFIVPASATKVFSVAKGAPAKGKAKYSLMQSVFDHGRGLRAFLPQIDTVAFLGEWDPRFSDYHLITYEGSGRMWHHGRPPDGLATLGSQWMTFGLNEEAAGLLETARAAYPDNDHIRLACAAALLRTGRVDSGRGILEDVMRSSPSDTSRITAARMLEQLNRSGVEAR